MEATGRTTRVGEGERNVYDKCKKNSGTPLEEKLEEKLEENLGAPKETDAAFRRKPSVGETVRSTMGGVQSKGLF